ncbi:inositol monophosphatase family protein [Micromonosporaceae bacterium Da 78-11]
MIERDSELAIAAAQAGAEVVWSGYGESQARFEKSPGDFATEADVEAEKAIVEVLRARPGDAVLGEESGQSGPADADRTWLVDPLCGTLNYAARSMLVAVNVALRTRDGITAAAVADPFSDEVFWTDGVTAHRRHAGSDEPLVPSSSTSLVDVNLDPPFGNAAPFRAAGLIADREFLARYRPRVLSTTLALTWVAAGRRAAYVTDGDLRDSVHFAAGIALCRAAGCVVTGIDGGPALTGVNGLLAAADAETHAALLARIPAAVEPPA